MRDYPWYEIIEDKAILEQGDFINDCPMIIPPVNLEEKSFPIVIQTYNVIILSQSCDLLNKKLNHVIVCPYWPLDALELKIPFLKQKKAKEEMRKGNLPAYHLLNSCLLPTFELGFLVVDFKNVFSVNFEFITSFSRSHGKRLRLLSPYRENLSQAFARFIMRVGLPSDIPAFE